MKILVAGGAGFLGSHFCDRLLSQGHDVVAIDNFVTGHTRNIAHLKDQKNFQLIEHDISVSVPDIGHIDAFCHLASPASPIDFKEKAIEILKVGSYGTFNAIEYAKKYNAWFFFTSTSEVYGDPLVHPQPESYLGNVNPNGVRGVYDESKRFSEATISAYRRLGYTKSSIVRIFNTYGPRMRPEDGRVVCTFIDQALKNEALTVFGDGSQTRSFCFVDDLISGFMQFLKIQPAGPLNLGNPIELTIKEIAQKIIQLTGSKSQIVYKDLPQDDPKQRKPELSNTKRELMWEPKVSVEEGLLKTIAHFKENNRQ